jgi:glycerol transport system ATP-binding protein
VTRVEDVGRHKIVRLDAGGSPVSAIAGEGEAIPASIDRIRFASEGINIYADDWRITPAGGTAA